MSVPPVPYVQDPDFTLHLGDVREVLPRLEAESVDCVVTSPPYLGLRDYGAEGQIGLEPTIGEYVATMVSVFAETRRILAPHGSVWLNLGDSFNAYNGGSGPGGKLSRTQTDARPRLASGFGLQQKKLKPKDLMMVPARVAIALCDDGWYLRSEILWCKPNGMVESIDDRPTKSSERIYLLAKSRRYYFGQDELRTPHRYDGRQATRRVSGGSAHSDYWGAYGRERWPYEGGANIRDWWIIPVEPSEEAHYGVMPQEVARRCILGGCPQGGTVFDPFGGAGTTSLVARKLGRKSILVELNPEYARMSAGRLQQLSLLAEGAA